MRGTPAPICSSGSGTSACRSRRSSRLRDLTRARARLARGAREGGGARLVRGRRALATLGLAALLGLSGAVYFPAFSCALILAAGVFGAMRAGSALRLARAAAFVAAVGAALAVNLAPSFAYFHAHGKTAMLERPASEAELFGLKITQLVLPVSGHRLDALRAWKEAYDRAAPLGGENTTEYLGVFGVAGFLYLLVTLLGEVRRPALAPTPGRSADLVADPEAMQGLRVLNVVAVLVATVGGFGAVFAWVVTSPIRSYNRVGVYLAFYALAALAVLVERALRRRPAGPWLLPALAVAGVVGVLDSSPVGLDRPYPALERRWREADAFLARVEAAVPADSEIFQLPFVPFPESHTVGTLADYALFEPYLHSRPGCAGATARSASAAPRSGTPTWRAARPPRSAEALATAGFGGIFVSRAGYADRGAALEAELTALLGPPLVDAASTDAFFPLAAAARAVGARLDPARLAERRDEIRNPPYLGWLDGFAPALEPGREGVSRGVSWPLRRRGTRRCALRGRSSSGLTSRRGRGATELRMTGDLVDHTFPIDESGWWVVIPMVLTPGEHFVDLESDGGARRVPGEPRPTVIGGNEPQLIDWDDPGAGARRGGERSRGGYTCQISTSVTCRAMEASFETSIREGAHHDGSHARRQVHVPRHVPSPFTASATAPCSSPAPACGAPPRIPTPRWPSSARPSRPGSTTSTRPTSTAPTSPTSSSRRPSTRTPGGSSS